MLLIALASSGWWIVSTSAGVVAVGDTANFRAVARFAAAMNLLLALAMQNVSLIHCELAMTGMSCMAATERLLRFTSSASSYDVRSVRPAVACGLAYAAQFPPNYDRTFTTVGQICYGGLAVTALTFPALKYLQGAVAVAAPHVRNKTSLRAPCARQVRDMVCMYLVLLVVLMRFAAFFSFVAEIIPMTEEQGCDADSRNASSACREFEGRSQCELNLGSLAAGMLMLATMSYAKLLGSGSSLTDVLSKMQAGDLPIGPLSCLVQLAP